MTKGVVKKDDRNRLTVRLSPELDAKLDTATKQLGITKNAYIIMAIEKATKNSPVVGATGERH